MVAKHGPPEWPPRIGVEVLERHILRSARKLGRAYLHPSNASEVDDESALLSYVMYRHVPPRCREVFQLHRVRRLEYEEIATLLNIEVGTVKKYLTRALKIFAHELEQLEREGVVGKGP